MFGGYFRCSAQPICMAAKCSSTYLHTTLAGAGFLMVATVVHSVYSYRLFA